MSSNLAQLLLHTDQLCEIVENANVITIHFDMPGVLEETIDVDFRGNSIVITGDRKPPYTSDFTVIRKEIDYGRFENRIENLPINVINRTSVKITLSHGVLRICIDKTNEEKHHFRIGVSTV